MNKQQLQPFTLVTGASGKTGRKVVEGLEAMNCPVRLAKRIATQPNDVQFDWMNTATWPNALQDIDAVYIAFYPDLALPMAAPIIRQFCELAAQMGVQHITILSGRGEEGAQHCEAIVQSSGLSWAVVRASWFNQNFSEGMFNAAVHSGVLAFPVDAVAEPFVDTDDIAEVVVATITKNECRDRLYEVTGPELLTFADLARIFSEKLNRNIQFVSLSFSTFAEELRRQQIPEDVISTLDFLFNEVLDGRNASLAHGVEQALGRKPTSFAQFVENNIEAFGGAK